MPVNPRHLTIVLLGTLALAVGSGFMIEVAAQVVSFAGAIALTLVLWLDLILPDVGPLGSVFVALGIAKLFAGWFWLSRRGDVQC